VNLLTWAVVFAVAMVLPGICYVWPQASYLLFRRPAPTLAENRARAGNLVVLFAGASAAFATAGMAVRWWRTPGRENDGARRGEGQGSGPAP
jgi:hypothetical protein